jgi:hypothetical protein
VRGAECSARCEGATVRGAGAPVPSHPAPHLALRTSHSALSCSVPTTSHDIMTPF